MSVRFERVSTRLTRNEREMIAHVLQQLIKRQLGKEPGLTTQELARRCSERGHNVSERLVNEVYISGRLPHMNLDTLQGFVHGLGLASGRGAQRSHTEVDDWTYEDCKSLILQQSEHQGTFWD